jgi:hypothetical protein
LRLVEAERVGTDNRIGVEGLDAWIWVERARGFYTFATQL